MFVWCFFFFSSRRRHTRCGRDWSSDVCSSDRHGLDQQHGRHERIAGKVSFEHGALGRDPGLHADARLLELNVENPVDHLKIFEAHWACDAYAVLATMRSSIRAHRLFKTKY